MAALEGRDKLTILTLEPRWDAFADWAEQLVAESTGKQDKGIVPIVREKLLSAEQYGNDRFFAVVGLEKSYDAQTEKVLKALEAAGHPVMRFKLADDYGLGYEMMRWEMATAVACAVMQIDPFDQPNVQDAKLKSKAILDGKSKTEVAAIPLDAAVESEAWKTFLLSIKAGDYVNILAFVPNREDVKKHLYHITDLIKAKTKCATNVGIGPRYLHSTGQLHKGGANNGVFLIVTAKMKPGEDKAIPESQFSFEQLISAQSAGDVEALKSRGRRYFYMELPDLSVKSYSVLLKSVNEIL
jgi:hypothetical protein